MNLPFQIVNKLVKFLKPRIYFTTIHNQYLYNDQWLIEMTEENFKKEVLLILNLVNNHLITGLNTKTFLMEFRELISFYIELYQLKSMQSKEFIDSVNVINHCHTNAPEPEKYIIKDILEEKESVIDSISNEENYYYDLHRFAKDNNNYKNPIDIEKVKLKYVLELYKEYMNIIYEYIDCILEDFDRINFEKFDFETLLISLGLTETNAPAEIIRKCNINLNKIDVANLFLLLMEEQLFVFDRDERKNKVMMQKFIEQNFTYKDDGSMQKNITKINKEFSKVGYANKSSQFNFIDVLISKLEERKLRFK